MSQIPQEINDILTSNKFNNNPYFLTLFNNALNKRGKILSKDIKVRKTKLSNTYIQPIKNESLFENFKNHILSFNNEYISLINLSAGISVKYNVNVNKMRNLFSLRHPRLRKNGILYVSFSLNSVTNKQDLCKLGVLDAFDFHVVDNYFMTNSVELNKIIDVVDDKFIKLLINYVTRKHIRFLNNCERIKKD